MVILILLFALISSCNNNPIGAEEIKPGRRDYLWSVDTLQGLNSPRYRMWGSSPTDIWAITYSNWDVSISHFNGAKWTSYGVPGIIQPSAIYGFSDTSVFLGDENGKIWKYNGNNWNLFAEIIKDGHTNIVFNDLWGESYDNFYAFGAYPDQYGYNNSVIGQYKNGSWAMFNTAELYGIITDLFSNVSDNKIYLIVNGGQNFTDSTKVYEYAAGKFYKLYGNIWTQGLQADISLIDTEVYFVLGGQISRRINNHFQTMLVVDNPNFYQRIWGRNSKDIFLLMTDGLAHYDGSDIKYLFNFNSTPRTQIYSATLFDDDVFFLVYEAQTGLSLVYHGKLN